MSYNTIITLGRQYGSLGKQIAIKLSEKLKVPYYDKELLKEAAKKSGICEEVFESFDEKPTNSFLYALVTDPYSLGFTSGNFEMPLNHKVFLAAFDTIKNIANEGPCLFIGRCADYALSDYKNVINIFIYAPMEFRAEEIAKREGVSIEKAKDIANKADKQRASYYNYYTTKKWGDIKSYNVCIDSSVLGVDGTVVELYNLIMKYNESINN